MPKQNSGLSAQDLFFSPLRFCGRQWIWISNKNDHNSQAFLKTASALALIIPMMLSGAIACAGQLTFPINPSRSQTKYFSGRSVDILKRDLSNEAVVTKIQDRLNSTFLTKVSSEERDIMPHGHYPDQIKRNITLSNPSSTVLSRFFKAIQYQFWNKDSSLDNLHECIQPQDSSKSKDENLKRLTDILELYKSITLSIAFDFAYVTTEVEK